MFFCGKYQGHLVRFLILHGYVEVYPAITNPNFIITVRFPESTIFEELRGATLRGNFTNPSTLSLQYDHTNIVIEDVTIDLGECREL